jgi:signal transduction histidine kinase
MIKTDEKRYKQVLFNLLGNAIKFTFNGGISVSVTAKDRKLITSVRDTGIGISSEDILKLFKFFGKVSSAKKINKGGMGFGLTISKMIV